MTTITVPEAVTEPAAPHRKRFLSWFTGMRVSRKISIALLTVLFISATGTVVALVKLHTLDLAAERIYNEASVPVTDVSDLRDLFVENRKAYLEASTLLGQPGLAEKLDAVKGLSSGVEEVAARVAGHAEAAGVKAQADDFVAAWTELMALRATVQTPALLANDRETFQVAFSGKGKEIAGRASRDLDELTTGITSYAATTATDARAQLRTAVIIVVVCLLLAILAGTVFTYLTVRSLTVPLRRLQVVLDAVADGDLTRVARVRPGDELGDVADALRRAQNAMRQTLAEVATQAEAVRGSSASVRSVSASLEEAASSNAAGATQLAASSNETSASVGSLAAAAEEMAATIAEVSRGAGEATVVSGQARELAVNAGEVVTRLDRHTDEAADVVRTISAIAEQTKLLALNATIEAARAGASGKGFAVVAEEVKKLAEGAAVASAEVGQRIGTIRDTTREAVAVIEQVVEVVDRVEGYSTNVAGAVEEQNATTAMMAQSITSTAGAAAQISYTASEVARSAEVSAGEIAVARGTAETLVGSADALAAAVGRFRI